MLQDHTTNVGSNKVRYWEAGKAGSDVILLHGIGCSVLEWQHNIEAMASRHRVLAVDLLGEGLSDKPADETYTLRRLAQFVLDFMTTKGIAKAHIVGNSLGGRLGLECAIIAPERVSSLLLADPAGMEERKTLLEFRLATIPYLGELLTKPNRLGTKMLWNKAFYNPAPFVTDELVTTKIKLANLPGAHAAFLKTLRAFLNVKGFHPDLVAQLQAALPSISAPTLVIWGKNDQFVPCEHAEVLRKKIRQSEVQIWDNCGHAPQIECSLRFNETALAFWEKLESIKT
jgi:pimeloyl-ACP methyl ester carboxylesterase